MSADLTPQVVAAEGIASSVLVGEIVRGCPVDVSKCHVTSTEPASPITSDVRRERLIRSRKNMTARASGVGLSNASSSAA